MNEQLVVKNFGPIKDATVDFKRVTVFIGPTGGGKSTLAKLAAVFRGDDFFGAPMETRKKHFSNYSLNNYHLSNTSFQWANGYEEYEIQNDLTQLKSLMIEGKAMGKLTTGTESITRGRLLNGLKDKNYFQEIRELYNNNPELKASADPSVVRQLEHIFRLVDEGKVRPKPAYFPSSRAFVPAVEYSWAGLLRDDIGLPKDILEFANDFSISRKDVPELDIPFLNVKYIHRSGQDFIKIPESETLFRLYETASGIQSVTPLLVLLEHLSRNTKQAQSFIIEEPELNLYPTAQQGLLNWVVEKCTKGENDLTITTHSPYLLAHFNLLLYAYQVAENHPNRADDVAKIVPRESWIDPKEFAAYHVEGQQESGVRSIVNPETGLISYNGLDSIASAETSEFEKLLDINAGLEVE